MKIVDMRVRCVAIPTKGQLRHNTGIHPGYFMRTILEIITDDIIVGGTMAYEDGCIKVPTGPGLGVDLDEEKMERYGRFYAEKDDYYARFLVDERRPNWFPIVGGR